VREGETNMETSEGESPHMRTGLDEEPRGLGRDAFCLHEVKIGNIFLFWEEEGTPRGVLMCLISQMPPFLKVPFRAAVEVFFFVFDSTSVTLDVLLVGRAPSSPNTVSTGKRRKYGKDEASCSTPSRKLGLGLGTVLGSEPDL